MTPRPVVTADDIDTVARLVREIWPEHYVPIIGQEQVDYMLANFQSAATIAREIREGDEYFLLELEGRPIGYCAIRAQPAESLLFLSKLYLHRSVRGRGMGAAALHHLEGLARERGLSRVWLKVNRHNASVQAYLRMGFTVAGEMITDIGGGFVMDDYRLEKPL